MKKILIFHNENEIAKEAILLCQEAGYQLDIYNTDIFKQSTIKKLSHQDYDGMLILPIHFEYDSKSLLNFNNKVWNKIINTNLKLTAQLLSAANNLLNDNSSIVTLSSADGTYGSYAGKYYAAAMAGKQSLVKSFANIYGKRNIRVNDVAAGWIGGVMDAIKDPIQEEINSAIFTATPLGRYGKPKEVAELILFLLSDKSSYINGQSILVDGGYGEADQINRVEYQLRF